MGDAGASTPVPRARRTPTVAVRQAANTPAWPQAAPPPANQSSEKPVPSTCVLRRRPAPRPAPSSSETQVRRGRSRTAAPRPVVCGATPSARAGPRPTEYVRRLAGGRPARARVAAVRGSGGRHDDGARLGVRWWRRRRGRCGWRERRQQLDLHGHRERQARRDLVAVGTSRRQPAIADPASIRVGPPDAGRRSRCPCARSARRRVGPRRDETDRSWSWRATAARNSSASGHPLAVRRDLVFQRDERLRRGVGGGGGQRQRRDAASQVAQRDRTARALSDRPRGTARILARPSDTSGDIRRLASGGTSVIDTDPSQECGFNDNIMYVVHARGGERARARADRDGPVRAGT